MSKVDTLFSLHHHIFHFLSKFEDFFPLIFSVTVPPPLFSPSLSLWLELSGFNCNCFNTKDNGL